MSIFSDLLKKTQEQADAQRLLLLFANAEAVTKKHKKQQKGTITPVMCVDKLPEEIASFEALVKEADSINSSWNFIFVASLAGDGDTPPTTDDAEPYLNKMAHDIESGQDIERYLVFDRQQNGIDLYAN